MINHVTFISLPSNVYFIHTCLFIPGNSLINKTVHYALYYDDNATLKSTPQWAHNAVKML